MAHKTDHFDSKKRTRIKTQCSPELKTLFLWVNQFPTAKEMKDIRTPFAPMKPLINSGLEVLQNDEKTDKWKKDEIEYQESLFISALAMLNDLKSRGFASARAFLALPSHWQEITHLGEKWIASNKAAWDYYEKARSGTIQTTSAEIIARFEDSSEDEKVFRKRKAAYARLWIDNYYRARAIKELLAKLAFVGRNFDAANKRLENAGFIDFDQLMPNLTVDDNGILQKEENPWIKLLIGSDVRRIKECMICRNFFWAERKDRMCCKEQCANIYNQRLSRDRKRESGGQYRDAAKKKRNAR